MEDENIAKVIKTVETNEIRRDFVADRLRRPIEQVGGAESHASITSVAEQLRASLAELQLVHKEVQTSLKRVREYTKAQEAAIVEQHNEGNDEKAGQADVRAELTTEQQKKLKVSIELLDLMGLVLQRIVPCYDLWDWMGGKVRACFFKLVSSQGKLYIVQEFMDERQDDGWHCLKCIVRGENDTIAEPRREFLDDRLDECEHSCSDTVYLTRNDDDDIRPGSQYYRARYISNARGSGRTSS
ncbi:hypothetical protein C8A03DRAFT_34965 [Achaetomium macrosporum]|uniref:Uncharacterized protein n=1 Tax=Achaetomium macrosporum TaxID=79813 RepID=A0AAN7HD76_9PEZI|nr:hypothetical protein C8A03DRAFT_34965 [Achaetomium macrosporum]